ncbi:MAG: tetratricopeptide repeat protein, partial [Rhodobacteraceae bacterium]|nr:tetratricopeptide repeat protein [Paracoccaceae bacterium]
RLELDGIDIGDRWEELADLSAARTEDGCLVFADLHYLLALTNDGRDGEVNQMLQRIHKNAQADACETDRCMASPGLSAAKGLQAFGESRFEDAFRHLAGARDTMQLAGGSHAQRDVFERMTIDAGIRAGYLDQAESLLDDRQHRRINTEDRYAAVRRDMITAGRGISSVHSVPAQ